MYVENQFARNNAGSFNVFSIRNLTKSVVKQQHMLTHTQANEFGTKQKSNYIRI